MILRLRKWMYHHTFWWFLAVGLLSACGGGGGIAAIVAAVGTVTPIAGAWRAPLGNLDEQLDIGLDLGSEVLFTEFFESNINVTALSVTISSVCGSASDLIGTLDNGSLVLRPKIPANSPVCLRGEFIDMVTLKFDSLVQPYQNSRVEVGMENGLWVSDGSDQLELKFIDPSTVDNGTNTRVRGCDVSSGTAVLFDSDDMIGFTAPDTKPSIPEIRSTTTPVVRLLKDIVFEDGATLTAVNALDEPVTLRRIDDTAPTCPP